MHKYITIICTQKKPLKFLLSRILMVLRLNHFFKVKRHGYILNFDTAALSSNIWIDNTYRTAEEKFLRTLLNPGDIVIDVGANIGTLTLACANFVGPAGHIYSFEPHPKIFGFLQKNIEKNNFKNITPLPFALGQNNQEMSLSNNSDDSQNSIKTKIESGVRVDMRPLDELISPQHKIKLLKIDVEGYEGEVLKGAKSVCSRTEILYVECIENFLNRSGWSKDELLALIKDYGFEIQDTATKMLLCKKH